MQDFRKDTRIGIKAVLFTQPGKILLKRSYKTIILPFLLQKNP
jgi:hypothetical protein